MNATIIVAIITVVGSILAAAITTYLTKAKDREAEWRVVKLTHYKRFMTALYYLVLRMKDGLPSLTRSTTFTLSARPMYWLPFAVLLTKRGISVRIVSKNY